MSPFPSLTAFAKAHPLYPHLNMITYLIYQDIGLKQEVEDISIVDGSTLDYPCYLIVGKILNSTKSRLFIPCASEETIDLTK